MSQVDDELAQALADSEATARAEDPVTVTHTAPQSGATTQRSLGLLAALLVMGAGILFLVLKTGNDATVYSRGVEDLIKEKARFTGRNVRVEGRLVKGSLKRRDQPCEYRFSMVAIPPAEGSKPAVPAPKQGAVLPVRYAACIVPDTFRDAPDMDVSVTAEGTLTAAGDFEATQILAKCPSKYEMRDRAKKGEQIPHAMGIQAANFENFK
jgi:cytochrome c-type biogenesis protein CcmE